MTTLSKRELFDAAQHIRDCMAADGAALYVTFAKRMEEIVQSMRRGRKLGRQLRVCAGRGWFAAAKQVSQGLAASLRGLGTDIQVLRNLLDRVAGPTPSLRELVAELEASEHEFGGLVYDRKEQFVAVTTEPIELEGVSLGEFEIRLLLNRRWDAGQEEILRVVALDPNSAGRDDSVTHPHVRDEHLCTGSATAVISSALKSGRIGDVFILVRSVLEEYNPQSAYVPLEEWDGDSCYDCGCNITSEEAYSCPSCSNDFCDDCMASCHNCPRISCQGCLTPCLACRQDVCRDCITRCPDCQRLICKKCLEENLCPCHQTEENENEPAITATQTAAAAG